MLHSALPGAALLAGELIGDAGVVAAQLALEQLEKQQAVDPGEAELEGPAKEAFDPAPRLRLTAGRGKPYGFGPRPLSRVWLAAALGGLLQHNYLIGQ